MDPSAQPHEILVVVDPAAHQQRALEKAAQLALRCAARLALYVCDVEQELPESWAGGGRASEYLELKRRQLLDELERLAAPLRERGLAVECLCEWQAAK
jgi:nucleotide-binding universal stress UspA family protein